MSEVPERGRPETSTKVLPDFSIGGFGSGRSWSSVARRSARGGISGRSKSCSRFGSAATARRPRRFVRRMTSLRWKAAFSSIAAFHVMDGREIAVGVHHVGPEAQRGLEGERCALGLARTRERNAEIEVRLRKPMEQANRAQGGIDGLLIVAGAPVNV